MNYSRDRIFGIFSDAANYFKEAFGFQDVPRNYIREVANLEGIGEELVFRKSSRFESIEEADEEFGRYFRLELGEKGRLSGKVVWLKQDCRNILREAEERKRMARLESAVRGANNPREEFSRKYYFI